MVETICSFNKPLNDFQIGSETVHEQAEATINNIYLSTQNNIYFLAEAQPTSHSDSLLLLTIHATRQYVVALPLPSTVLPPSSHHRRPSSQFHSFSDVRCDVMSNHEVKLTLSGTPFTGKAPFGAQLILPAKTQERQRGCQSQTGKTD